MPFVVRHADVHQRVFLGEIVELGPRISVRDGNLNGLGVHPFREIDGIAQRLARLARQPHDEIAVNRQPQFVAILGEAHRHVDGRALLDVLQNLLVALS